jgi:low affinity Fe/Cu permease
MVDIITDILGYSGTESIDLIVVGAATAIILLIGIVVIDNIFRIFRTLIDFTRR